MSEKPPLDDSEQAAHSATPGRRHSVQLALFMPGGGRGSHLLFLLTSLLIGPAPGVPARPDLGVEASVHGGSEGRRTTRE